MYLILITKAITRRIKKRKMICELVILSMFDLFNGAFVEFMSSLVSCPE